MGTQDISRNAFDRNKHYASVRFQQGRILTDDDWNESQRIREELNREALVNIIGAAASPDQGFQIVNPQRTGDGIDFDILAGSFYLGGQQLSLEEEQSFLLQSDWLQGPNEVSRPEGERIDLVYLETYQQVVSAVEDSELYEVALGSADTCTRLRNVQRVHVYQGVSSDECAQAWNQRLNAWSSSGSLNKDQALIADAQLTVDFTEEDNSGDLCKPNPAGGYLGAENQTIRVQLRNAQTFTWGFDNAAPLYRVSLSADRSVLTLLTPPKDQYHWPQAEQTVEILAWSSLLPNGEKVAAYEGFLTRVTASYDPSSGQISIAEPLPEAGFDDWQARADVGDIEGEEIYYYLRVWNRGPDRESDNAIAFTPGTAVALGYTGLQVTFAGSQFNSGDYWLISARPSAPQEVMPWALEITPGQRSLGIKKYYTPLALLHWLPDNDVTVSDCRKTFKPLNQACCCVELVARPGAGWYHIFEQIPNGADAYICLPPGDYPVPRRIRIRKKGRILITGAGKSSRIFGKETDRLLVFENCDLVEMRDLYVFGTNQHRSGIKGTLTFSNVSQVELHRVAIRNKAGRHRDMTCLRIDNDYLKAKDRSGRVRIQQCEFYVGHLQTGILIVNADHIDIRENRLLPSGPNVEPIRYSLRDPEFQANLAQASIAIADNPKDIPDAQQIIVNGEDGDLFFVTDPLLKPFWEKHIQDQHNDFANFTRSKQGILRILLKNHMKTVLDSQHRRINEAGVSDWLESLEQLGKALIGQGIVVGGRRAHYVNISDNHVGDSVQGIHVGLSHSSINRSFSGADVLGDVYVRNNRIHNRLGAGMEMERHGCFVGNLYNALITDNSLTLERSEGFRHLAVEAIRVFGFLGEVVRVNGNRAQGYTKTGLIAERGKTSGEDLRVIKENHPEF